LFTANSLFQRSNLKRKSTTSGLFQQRQPALTLPGSALGTRSKAYLHIELGQHQRCHLVDKAIVNAVIDALADYGVTHLDMPLTSEKVWRAMHASKVS